MVHHEDALIGDPALSRLFDRDGPGPEDEVALDPVLVRLDHVADGADGLGHLDPERSHRGGAVDRHQARREDGMLDAIEDDAERGVDHPADG